MVARNVSVTKSPEEPGAFGNDWMQGNDGDDEGYGQQGDDYMEGNNGEDALLGDLGLITSSVQDGSNEQVTAPPGPFFEETVYPAGSFYRKFTLFSFTGVPAAAGNDIILGGDDRDSIHGADGDDILNGDGDAIILDTVTGVDPNPLTADVDKVFGGDGDDVMWGGRDDDNMWGGHGDDHLDVRPRSGFAEYADDPPLWHTFGRFDFYQGLDLIYGGWGRDALQADVAAPGPRDTDRLSTGRAATMSSMSALVPMVRVRSRDRAARIYVRGCSRSSTPMVRSTVQRRTRAASASLRTSFRPNAARTRIRPILTIRATLPATPWWLHHSGASLKRG
jgi:hypothetical protein